MSTLGIVQPVHVSNLASGQVLSHVAERLNTGVAFRIPAVLYYSVAKEAPKKPPKIIKAVDEEYRLTKPRKGARLRREVWQSADGRVVRYNLAYINHRICGRDNGRVLGYDNSHDGHHRHFMGSVAPVEFDGYDAILKRFEDELAEMWRKEDEEAKS